MRALLWGSAFVLCLFLGGSVGVSYLSSADQPRASLADLKGSVARGAYLARVSGCIACHTDTKCKPLAGGKAIETPFGTFYAPNITTDKVQGIGDWTVDEFERALRTGKSPKGKSYYPAFPYSFYTRLTDQDIADLWAAFKTVPAVSTPSTTTPISSSLAIDMILLKTFSPFSFSSDNTNERSTLITSTSNLFK